MCKRITNTSEEFLRIGEIQLFQELYTGENFEEYVIFASCDIGSAFDSLYAFRIVDGVPEYIQLVGTLTKYRRYTWAIINNRVYFANGIDPVGWIRCDMQGNFTTGVMEDAPIGEFLISAKSRLWLGGITRDEYTEGTALFTNGNTLVTGIGTLWQDNLRANDLIGTTLTPTIFYKVRQVLSDTSLELTEVYAEPTTGNDPYAGVRITKDTVYYGAERALDNWFEPGVFAGDDAAFLQLGRVNEGLINYDDNVVLFTDIDVNALAGQNPVDWNIPQHTRIPVGAISHWSIVVKDRFMAWMSNKGYFISKGGSLNFPALDAEPYSMSVQEKFQQLDTDIPQWVQSAVYNEYLFITIPAKDVYDENDPINSWRRGVVSVSADSDVVIGMSTNWLGNVRPQDQIRFLDSDTIYTIESITNDTRLVLTQPKPAAYSGAYKILKRRSNRIMVLDTRVNLVKKQRFGWTVYDDVNPNGFVVYQNRLLYGSSTGGYIYEYNIGGRLYDKPIYAFAKTARFLGRDAQGSNKYFKGLYLRARGIGTVFITPICDGVPGTRISHEFTNATQYEEVYFPKRDNPFSYRGKEIQLMIELFGIDENIIIMPPAIGYIPQSKRQGK